MRSEPRDARIPVWALPVSLAATSGIDVSFFSSGYLDVSVHRVPLHTLWIGVWMIRVLRTGFPHSDICGSRIICISPQLFAAYHVFLRLLVPRHPPCALLRLTFRMYSVTCGSLGCLLLVVLITSISGSNPSDVLWLIFTCLTTNARKTSFPHSRIFAEYPLPVFLMRPFVHKCTRSAFAIPAGCSAHD